MSGWTRLSHVAARWMRLSPPETLAIAIECCYQNTGIATSVAITMYADPVQRAQAVAVRLVYGLLESVFVCVYCLYAWRVLNVVVVVDGDSSYGCGCSTIIVRCGYNSCWGPLRRSIRQTTMVSCLVSVTLAS
jgi:hypothetical protein